MEDISEIQEKKQISLENNHGNIQKLIWLNNPLDGVDVRDCSTILTEPEVNIIL